MQRGPHGDEGKAVGVRKTQMGRKVERLPWERTQAPLCCGAVYGLRNQPDRHLVVRHLQRGRDTGEEKGRKINKSVESEAI